MNRIPFPTMARPLVAILRGLDPSEARDVAAVLIDAGLTAIEVPLNSPDPFRSIETIAGQAGPDVLVGAGTVLTPDDAERVHAAGGRLVVTPNVEPAVIARSRDLEMVTLSGVFTPTEAFLAERSGASGLKFFPASVLGPSGIAAIKAVLPKDLMLAAVGGVSDENFAAYVKAGVTSFGLGGSLFKPGMSIAQIADRARATVKAYDLSIAHQS